MNINKTLINNYKYQLMILIILVISSILILSGCSSSTKIGSSIEMDQTNNIQPVEDEPIVNHNIDPQPAPLINQELELSLEGYGAKGALSDDELTILDMLMYAVQDEYLAHGEYLTIIDEFEVQRPYTNIVKSEETHLLLLEEVYESYSLDFPIDTSSDHLIIPSSLLEAAETGVIAEIDNIEMYDKFLEYDLPENIELAFIALKKGSESHLLAFQKQVDRLS